MPNGVARRDFLRACAVTGLGLGFGFQRQGAEAGIPCPAGNKARGEAILVGLEIGTSKVCAVVAERLPDGTIKFLGIGRALSRGVTKYGIVEIEAASACVREALVDAEIQSNVMIGSVVLAVAGMKIAPYGCGPGWERIFEWEEICYTDRGDGLLHRVGRADCKRTRDLRVVSGAGMWIQNSNRCLKDIGVEVERIVFAPVASAEAVLSAGQKMLGALVIDMGEGTTDYAVYAGSALVQSDCFAGGGEKIANDLSLGLRIPLACAEKLAIEEGSVRLGQSLPGERIVLEAEPGFAGREVEREMLNTIIHCRVRGTFEWVKRRLESSGVRLDFLGAGVHLTGGCSMLRGIDELAREVFGLPAHLARVIEISGSVTTLGDPQHSCALGLVKFG